MRKVVKPATEIIKLGVSWTGTTAEINTKKTYADGHGFFPVLSAQGNKVEHASFQPAHREYVGDPHAGQN